MKRPPARPVAEDAGAVPVSARPGDRDVLVRAAAAHRLAGGDGCTRCRLLPRLLDDLLHRRKGAADSLTAPSLAGRIPRHFIADALQPQLLAGTDPLGQPLLVVGSRLRWSLSRLRRVESPCFAAKLRLQVSEVPSAAGSGPRNWRFVAPCWVTACGLTQPTNAWRRVVRGAGVNDEVRLAAATGGVIECGSSGRCWGRFLPGALISAWRLSGP
jgi:hypothetical protein